MFIWSMILRVSYIPVMLQIGPGPEINHFEWNFPSYLVNTQNKTKAITNFVEEWPTSAEIDCRVDTALHQAQILCIQSQWIASIGRSFCVISTSAALDSKHFGSITRHHYINIYHKVDSASNRFPFESRWSDHIKCIVWVMKILENISLIFFQAWLKFLKILNEKLCIQLLLPWQNDNPQDFLYMLQLMYKLLIFVDPD